MADGMDYQHQRQRSGTASQRSVRVEAPMEPVEPVPSVPSIHQIPPSSSGTAVTDQEKIDMESKPLETTFSPDPQVAPAMRKFRQKRTKSIDLDDYFVCRLHQPCALPPANLAAGRTTRHRQALQVAHVPAHARKHLPGACLACLQLRFVGDVNVRFAIAVLIFNFKARC